MKALTRSQKQVYDFVCQHIKKTGYSPTFREIQAHFKYSSLASVFNFVKILKKKGFISDESRSCIALTSPMGMFREDRDELEVPFIGTIAQGFPIETFPQAKTVRVPSSLVRTIENTYVLKAKGETLHEERIADGDLLIVEARKEAHFGEIVLATINSCDTMIKRYFPEDGYVRLEGSSEQHHPIILEKDEVTIQGVLIGLIRAYTHYSSK